MTRTRTRARQPARTRRPARPPRRSRLIALARKTITPYDRAAASWAQRHTMRQLGRLPGAQHVTRARLHAARQAALWIVGIFAVLYLAGVFR